MKIIGIDTGVNTGFAVWNTERENFDFILSVKIHTALQMVKEISPALVRVEDARLYKHYGKTNPKIIQQVGSVKRDAVVWEDFLTAFAIPFEMVAPSDNLTKLPAREFARMTGWLDRTNEHGRDAAMLVFQWKPSVSFGSKQNKLLTII